MSRERKVAGAALMASLALGACEVVEKRQDISAGNTTEPRVTEVTPVPSFTPEPTSTSTEPPTLTKTPTPEPTPEVSEYQLAMSEELLSKLNTIEGDLNFTNYAGQAETLINSLGITDPEIQEIYRDFYNTNWGQSQDILAIVSDNRVFGVNTAIPPEQFSGGREGYALHSAVGAFYGFVPRESSGSPEIRQRLETYDIEPNVVDVILQVRPGKFTPEENPNAFIAVTIGLDAIKDGIGSDTGQAVSYLDNGSGRMRSYVPQRRATEDSLAFRGTEVWKFSELEDAFGLKRGGLVMIHGDPKSPGVFDAAWFRIIDNDPPSEEIMEMYNFTLGD